MKEFTSIRQFRDVVQGVRRYCVNNGKPLPTLNFTGRVKLHGSNGGLVITSKGELRIQSRTRTIDTTCDNAGFAAWATAHREQLIELLDGAVETIRNVTYFGEWCGGNIQDKVALAQLPKHFVLFGAYIDDDTETYVPFEQLTGVFDHSIEFWNIAEAPAFSLAIDFNEPHKIQDILTDLTMEVEAACPWGAMRGVTGIGEGIVWTCDERPHDQDLWFKTKGDAHAKSAKASKLKIVADPEKLASINELVDRILPQWRLDQGFTALREQGVVLNTTATGAYLQWICKDVLKEEADTIEASGFEWKKDVNSHVIQRARQHFLKVLNDEAFSG